MPQFTSDSSDAGGSASRRWWLPSPGWTAVIVVVLVAFGFVAAVWWPYHRERRIIDQIRGPLGVKVSVSPVYEGPEILEPYANREWMRWFHRVGELQFYDALWTKQQLARFPDLDPLRQCRHVRFTNMNLENAQYTKPLSRCRALQSVAIYNCELAGDALRGLDGSPILEEITIASCYGPVVALELPAASSLRAVRVNHASFSGFDVSRSPNLSRLEAKNCRIDDAGLRLLAGAPQLEVVMIPCHYGPLTDESIETFLQLPSLRHLDLRFQHQLTGPALERLAVLPRLDTVNVFHTAADEDLEGLRRVLPQAKSTYSP